MSEMNAEMVRVIDSHTAGEPTRVVIESDVDLGNGRLTDRAKVFKNRWDHLRTAIVLEPRGSDPVVGALLCAPHDETCDAAVIFFNNVGYLGMCGHGMIGVVQTLRHLGQIGVGRFRIETPVGVVTAEAHQDETVSVENVTSYRIAKDFVVNVPSLGQVRGDVAWGGNWFFLVKSPLFEVSSANVIELTNHSMRIREAVCSAGHSEVDHIELFASETPMGADSKNFVLCPGAEYDRSPCGTGTSAKMACLAADGSLAAGELWRQAGVLGTCFSGRYSWQEQSAGRINPIINGRAFITAESSFILDPGDPFRWGIRRDE